MKLLVIQNSHLAPLGILGECIVKRNGQMKIIATSEGDKLPSQGSYFDGLIILGGPMNAEDDENHPCLREIVNLIHQFTTEHKPILGICLGAQILARAFGKRVYPHHTFELGFTPVFTIGDASEDLLLRNCPEVVHLMEWHFDTFDLPKEATLLMSSQICKNQAYKIHDNIYGFQFHLEVNQEIIQNWIDAKDEYVEINYPELAAYLAQQMETYLNQSIDFCWNVGHAWLDLVEARMNASAYLKPYTNSL